MLHASTRTCTWASRRLISPSVPGPQIPVRHAHIASRAKKVPYADTDKEPARIRPSRRPKYDWLPDPKRGPEEVKPKTVAKWPKDRAMKAALPEGTLFPEASKDGGVKNSHVPDADAGASQAKGQRQDQDEQEEQDTVPWRLQRKARWEKAKPGPIAKTPLPIPLCPESQQVSDYLKESYYPKLLKKGQKKQIKDRDDLAVNHKRLHVVSKPLCSDILKRMGPSLAKHRGCDIIDLNPGPGVWSSALHDILQPRTHIMMEPEEKHFRPFLQPLVDAQDSKYKLIPQSGYTWNNLEAILNPEYLPHQVEYPKDDPRLEEPNNSLLFVANLSFFPKATYKGFKSVSTLLLYQLMTAARSHLLFQKYGLVRMLIWVGDDEKQNMFPKLLHTRMKSSVEAEINFEYIEEIASSTVEQQYTFREHSLDLQSCMAALERMKANSITTPAFRESDLLLEAMQSAADPEFQHEMVRKSPDYHELLDLEAKYSEGRFVMYRDTPDVKLKLSKKKLSSYWTPEFARMYALVLSESTNKRHGRKWEGTKRATELDELRARFAAGGFTKYSVPESEIPMRSSDPKKSHRFQDLYTPEFLRLYHLRVRDRGRKVRYNLFQRLIDDLENIIDLQKKLRVADKASAEALQIEIDEKLEAWKEEIGILPDVRQDMFTQTLDNYRCFHHHEPPILYWDRRQAEPLRVFPQEFFPQYEMALQDFQPKSLWPVLRENYPKNYDVLEYLVTQMLQIPTQSIKSALTSLAPGAYEWLIAECPSLTDPNKGGNPQTELWTARCLSQEMYKEMMDAWLRWPFRPSRLDLIRKTGSDSFDEDEDDDIYHRFH